MIALLRVYLFCIPETQTEALRPYGQTALRTGLALRVPRKRLPFARPSVLSPPPRPTGPPCRSLHTTPERAPPDSLSWCFERLPTIHHSPFTTIYTTVYDPPHPLSSLATSAEDRNAFRDYIPVITAVEGDLLFQPRPVHAVVDRRNSLVCYTTITSAPAGCRSNSTRAGPIHRLGRDPRSNVNQRWLQP